MTRAGLAVSQLELDRFVAALLALLDEAPDAETVQQQLLCLIISLARFAPDDGALHDAVQETMAKTRMGMNSRSRPIL